VNRALHRQLMTAKPRQTGNFNRLFKEVNKRFPSVC